MTADEAPGADTIEFRAEARAVPKRRRFPVFALIASVVLAGAGAGGYYLWSKISTDGDVREVPLIRAQPGPIKVKPETAGGMNVPDRDKTVFDRMEGEEERPGVERLLPVPEQPRPPPRSQPGDTARAPEPAPPQRPTLRPAIEEASRPPETLRAPLPPAPEAVASAPPSALPVAVQSPPVSVDSSSAIPGPAKSGYLVQLAAARSEDSAKGEWDRLKRSHGDVLGKFDVSIMRVDLGPERGIFFRVRAGPIADENVARAVCAALVERKQGCLVVRPEG